MRKTDPWYKELLRTFFVEFLRLFYPEILEYLDTTSIEFLDKETFADLGAGERREADLVARARFKDRDAYFLFHVESQGTLQARFPRRMFGYFARFDERHELPIYPIALLTYDSPRTPAEDRYVVEFPDLKVLSYQYRVVQLNRLDWQEYLDRANPVASALMARMRMTRSDRAWVKVECLRTLGKLGLDPARRALVSGFVDSQLDLDPEEEQEFTARLEAIGEVEEKEATMEIVTSWMRRGIEQGMERGIEQGEERIVRRLLLRRFGTLPTAVESRLERLSSVELEEFADALLDFKEIGDAEEWLRSRS